MSDDTTAPAQLQSRPRDEVPWSVADGLVLVVWPLVAGVVVGTMAGAFGLDIADDAAYLVTSLVIQVVVLGGAIGWLALRGALTSALLGDERPRPRHALVGVGVGIVGYGLVFLTIALLLLATGQDDIPEQETLSILASGSPLAIVIGLVVAVVMAPVVEELTFRSVLFQALRARVGAVAAMVTSAVMFGAAHLELILSVEGDETVIEPAGLIGMAAISVFGLWLAATFHRTRSLIVPVVAHATFNAVNIALALTA